MGQTDIRTSGMVKDAATVNTDNTERPKCLISESGITPTISDIRYQKSLNIGNVEIRTNMRTCNKQNTSLKKSVHIAANKNTWVW